MAPNRRVAVIQWEIKPLAPEENHATACKYIRDAAAQGAELAVLPEYHLNGFNPESPLYATQAASTAKYLENYQALAKELHICLVPGTIVEQHTITSPTSDPAAHGAQSTTKHALYNTAYFISHSGDILGHYRKKNLWHPERPYLTCSGQEPHEVFDTPVGKVGLLICWDLGFPEAFRELIAKGAELVVIPTFWTSHDSSPACRAHNPDAEALFLETTLTARCFENTCGVIFSNAASGPGDTEKKYLGMSRVAMPIVGPVGKMGAEEGLLVVDVDMGLLRLAEENYKVREDIAREGWHYVYRHQYQNQPLQQVQEGGNDGSGRFVVG